MGDNFRWREKDLDNELFLELRSKPPSEKKIRELVRKGANVNSICETGDSVLQDILLWIQDGFDIKWIKLLIDLGADINYMYDDSTPLFDACLTEVPDIVEYMLEKGANPNQIFTDVAMSLLDWVKADLSFYKTDTYMFSEDEKEKGTQALEEIVMLLKKYGAKSIRELKS